MQVRGFSPDLIATNGRFYTATAEAIEAGAIKDGWIVGMGWNEGNFKDGGLAKRRGVDGSGVMCHVKLLDT